MTENPHTITVSPHHGPRSGVLYTAAEAVLKDRQDLHGKPEDSFKAVADLWQAYGGPKYSRADVAIMLICLKIARAGKTPTNKENWADIAGYAACGFEAALADEQKENIDLAPDLAPKEYTSG